MICGPYIILRSILFWMKMVFLKTERRTITLNSNNSGVMIIITARGTEL